MANPTLAERKEHIVITPEEVVKALKKLSFNKAVGLD